MKFVLVPGSKVAGIKCNSVLLMHSVGESGGVTVSANGGSYEH